MDQSAYWFAALASLGTLGLSGGVLIGRRMPRASRVLMIVCILLLIGWAWLFHFPSVTVNLLPAWTVDYLEGTAGAPVCMLLLGLAFARSVRASQRRVCVLAMVFTGLYFINGGFWMLQSTPQAGFAGTDEGVMVQQSQSFSCVPAACATALNLLELPTTEQQMANLTRTRPGTGATLLRAKSGLDERLRHSGYEVLLLQPTIEELQCMPTPMITPIRTDEGNRYLHMVVVINCSQQFIVLLDPSEGLRTLTWDEFNVCYTKQVLMFHHKR